MTWTRDISALAAGAAILLAGAASLVMAGRQDLAIHWFASPLPALAWLAAMAAAGWMLWRPLSGPVVGLALLGVITLGGLATLDAITPGGAAGPGALGLWLFVVALGFLAWRAMALLADCRLANRHLERGLLFIIPAVFGFGLLFLWEISVLGFGVSPVLLPAPSAIGQALAANVDILASDFYQTFAKAVLAGYAMGCGGGFLVGVMVDRIPFLKRGLLPLGNLVSALPIVGVAPIMVMWFGFDWQSKAAVVSIMTFFPMLVNTIAGLAASGAMERDLLRSYGASYGQTLIKLRLPSGMPFVFNALKINSTLALIGAIVAEFFGTPIVGMGFRISTEIGRMNLDMVWATIAVAALAGSLFYGGISLVERVMTFWHPSFRQ
jgi:NitT/TauT family transport system permease protein